MNDKNERERQERERQEREEWRREARSVKERETAGMTSTEVLLWELGLSREEIVSRR